MLSLCVFQVDHMTSHIEAKHAGCSVRMRKPLPVVVNEQQVSATRNSSPRARSPASASSTSSQRRSPAASRRGPSPIMDLFAPLTSPTTTPTAAGVSRSRSGSRSPGAARPIPIQSPSGMLCLSKWRTSPLAFFFSTSGCVLITLCGQPWASAEGGGRLSLLAREIFLF